MAELDVRLKFMNYEDNPYVGREAVMHDFAVDAQQDGKHFFYIRIPGDIKPLDRGTTYEDHIHDKLIDSSLGEFTGGGSQLGRDDQIEFCGIDVVVYDQTLGLNLIRMLLRSLGAPMETIIEEYLPFRVDHPLHDNTAEQGAAANP